jgi:hypothetical protein
MAVEGLRAQRAEQGSLADVELKFQEADVVSNGAEGELVARSRSHQPQRREFVST